MSEEGMKETPDIMFALQDLSCHFKSLNNSWCTICPNVTFHAHDDSSEDRFSLGTVVATKILTSRMQNEALSFNRQKPSFYSLARDFAYAPSMVQICYIMEFYITKIHKLFFVRYFIEFGSDLNRR